MKNIKFFLFDFVIILFWFALVAGTYLLTLPFYLFEICSLFLFPIILINAFITLCCIAVILPRAKPGRYRKNSREATYWFIQFQFARVWRYPPIYHFIFSIGILRWIFFKCFGAKISFSASISSLADIHDLYLLEIGEESVIGMHTTIVGHYILKDYLILGRVYVGDRTTIGAFVAIGPSTFIGSDCLVEADCRILPHSRLNNGKRLHFGEVFKGEK